MGLVKVTDKQTGEESFVSEADYSPAEHELAPDQVATVDPLGEGGEFAIGQDVTEASVAGGLYQAITPEARAALTREQVDEDLYGGNLEMAKQAGRGLLHGFSGFSENFIVGDDPFEIEAERRKRGVHQTAFTAGQIAGEVGSVLIPGTQIKGLKTAGRLLSYTPGGIAAKAAGRIAGRSPGVARAAASGAFDGALSAAGNSMAEQALMDKPFSFDVLGADAMRGAFIGGGVGGGLNLLGKATSKISDLAADGIVLGKGPKSMGSDDISKRLAKAADEVADDIPSDAAGFSWRNVYSQADTTPAQIATSAGDVVRGVDKSSALLRKARQEAKAMFSDDVVMAAQARGVPKEVVDAGLVKTKAALENFAAAKKAANKWAKDFTKASGGSAGLAKGKLPPLVGEDADEAVRILTNLDEAKLILDDVVSKTKKQMQPAPFGGEEIVEEVVEEIPKTGLKGFIQRSKESRLGSAVTDVAAGGELMGEVTGVRPSSIFGGIPVVGEIASMFLKYRGLRNALGKTGLIGRTATTEAAAKASSAGNRIAGSAKSLTKKAGKGLRSVKAPSTGARAVDLSVLGEAVRGQSGGLAPSLANKVRAVADRALTHLEANQPPDPLKGTPWDKGQSSVNPLDKTEFNLRVQAVENPILTLEQINAGVHPLPLVAVGTLQDVYPDIYAQMQSELIDNIDALAKTVSIGRRNLLGIIWDVPLTFSQNPEFIQPVASPAPGAQPGGQPEARRPAPSTVSKTANLSAEEGDKRR